MELKTIYTVSIQQFTGTEDKINSKQVEIFYPNIAIYEDLEKALSYAKYEDGKDDNQSYVITQTIQQVPQNILDIMFNKKCGNIPMGAWKINIKTKTGHDYTIFTRINFNRI